MNGRVLYNEIDPFAAAWLRALVANGSLPAGDVDERDIRDLVPSELDAYTHVHLFAGIGGWALALRYAGWAENRPCWTGSCPCQPFSAAGRGGGFADERHLWPAFFHLIGECRPASVFGEQVASPAGLAWFDLVHADLEGAGYAVGAADLSAAGVGAPHIRQRLWWVAHAEGGGRAMQPRIADAGRALVGSRVRASRGIGDGICSARACGPDVIRSEGRVDGYWSNVDWLRGLDGKTRPVEPGVLPLAHGLSGRVGKLRGAGNAIVPQTAAEFVRACA